MSTMDMAHWESRRNNEFVESVTYVAYEHIRHNTLFKSGRCQMFMNRSSGERPWLNAPEMNAAVHRLMFIDRVFRDPR